MHPKNTSCHIKEWTLHPAALQVLQGFLRLYKGQKMVLQAQRYSCDPATTIWMETNPDSLSSTCCNQSSSYKCFSQPSGLESSKLSYWVCHLHVHCCLACSYLAITTLEFDRDLTLIVVNHPHHENTLPFIQRHSVHNNFVRAMSWNLE